MKKLSILAALAFGLTCVSATALACPKDGDDDDKKTSSMCPKDGDDDDKPKS